MTKKQDLYDNEIINLRAFYLRLLGKLWLIPAALALGAVIGGLIYFLATSVFAPARNYVSESTLYIYFAYDENKGTQVDEYNAYTWNILVKTDDILNEVMRNLEKNGYQESVLPRDKVATSMNADIPSDVRVMVFTVSYPDRDICAAILKAANDALVSYGESNKAFEEIEVLSASEPSLEIVSDRMVTAVIFGAVLAVAFMILGMLLADSMDDAIYVPEDAEKRYHQPVLGVLTRKGQEEPSYFRNEILEMLDSVKKNIHSVAIFCADDKTGKAFAEQGTDRLGEVVGSAMQKSDIQFIPLPHPGNDRSMAAELSKVQGAVIMVRMGKRNGAMTEHLISMLRKMECPVLGLIIIDADQKFLSRYLGL